MRKHSALKFYLETLEVQAAFGDEQLVKEAEEGIISSLISKVKDIISSKIDPNDPVKGVINFLAPGAVAAILKALGFGWVGLAVGLLMDVFDVDVAKIINSVSSEIRNLISGGKQVSPEQVDSKVESEFQTYVKEDSSSDLLNIPKWFSGEGSKFLSLLPSVLSKNSYHNQIIKNGQVYRLTLSRYKDNNLIIKTAGVRTKMISLLIKAIKWIFKVILMSGGLLVGSEVVKDVTGIGKEKEGPQIRSQSKQTYFKVKSTYNVNELLNSKSSTWVEGISPNQSNIQNVVLDWMSEVYDGAENYEDVAKSTAGFNEVVKEIVEYNSDRKGSMTFIPRIFPNKKNTVDLFIDEVANKVQASKPETKEKPKS